MRVPAPVLDEATAWGLAQILTRVAEGTDRPSDGEPQVSMTVDGLSLPDPGGTRPVACPVCGATNDLRLAWDGYAGTVTCPDGHGEWLPGIGRREWRWIYATATRQR